jgi:hypothetical protein
MAGVYPRERRDMMSSYGDVGRMDIDSGWSVFMVVGEATDEIIRRGKDGYRLTLVLAGNGFWSGGLIVAGRIIPVIVSDPKIKWLDAADWPTL